MRKVWVNDLEILWVGVLLLHEAGNQLVSLLWLVIENRSVNVEAIDKVKRINVTKDSINRDSSIDLVSHILGSPTDDGFLQPARIPDRAVHLDHLPISFDSIWHIDGISEGENILSWCTWCLCGRNGNMDLVHYVSEWILEEARS